MFDRTLSFETRVGTLVRHYQEMVRATGCSKKTFAVRFVEHYHANVAPPLRLLHFQVGGDPARDAQTNAQTLAQWADPDSFRHFAAEGEESWVFALGEPFTTACRRDLARRYGLLDVPLMADTDCDIAAVGALTARFSDVLLSIAPAMADGKIDEADMEHLPGVLQELDNLCAAAVALRNRIAKAKRAAKRGR